MGVGGGDRLGGGCRRGGVGVWSRGGAVQGSRGVGGLNGEGGGCGVKTCLRGSGAVGWSAGDLLPGRQEGG